MSLTFAQAEAEAADLAAFHASEGYVVHVDVVRDGHSLELQCEMLEHVPLAPKRWRIGLGTERRTKRR